MASSFSGLSGTMQKKLDQISQVLSAYYASLTILQKYAYVAIGAGFVFIILAIILW